MIKHENLKPRKDFKEKLADRGFILNENDHYWQETLAYEFKEEQINELDRVASEMQDICVEAAQYIIDRNLFFRFGIKNEWIDYIVKTWDRDDPTLYGRFDFIYDGKTAPKLLEYNADTPTGLLEASVLQWDWLKDRGLEDQFNSIHEELIESWLNMKQKYKKFPETMYFTCDQDSGEDWVTTEYIRDTCEQAGINTESINIVDIGFGSTAEYSECFVDTTKMSRIPAMFKLYPWEFMAQDEYGCEVIKDHTGFIEPAWKMLWSNKALLPILWEIAPNHPNLLEAHFSEVPFIKREESYVKKALFGREGASVEIVDPHDAQISEGDYGQEGYIYQKYHRMPEFGGKYPVCGVWIVNGKPCGLGIREDDTRITKNTSNFVPHFFKK
jgi:glutathionylspermidine synthase